MWAPKQAIVMFRFSLANHTLDILLNFLKEKCFAKEKKLVEFIFWGSHLELHLQTKGAYFFLTHVCKIALQK
jgi:hypothetical protein